MAAFRMFSCQKHSCKSILLSAAKTACRTLLVKTGFYYVFFVKIRSPQKSSPMY